MEPIAVGDVVLGCVDTLAHRRRARSLAVALARARMWTVDEIDLVEIHGAFASPVLSWADETSADRSGSMAAPPRWGTRLARRALGS